VISKGPSSAGAGDGLDAAVDVADTDDGAAVACGDVVCEDAGGCAEHPITDDTSSSRASSRIPFFERYDIHFLLYFSQRRFKPLMDPTVSPVVKYFCRKGYTSMIGRVDTTMVAILIVWDKGM
jgi:hypothetical protein